MQPTTPSFRNPRPRIAGTALLAGALTLVASSASALDPAELQQLLQAEAEVRAVGGGILSWASDQSPSQPAPVQTIDVTTVPTITHTALEAILVPEHVGAVPELDPWGNSYEFRLDPAWSGSGSFGGVRSAGADGVFEGTVYSFGDNVAPSDDLVRWDGLLVRRLGAPFLNLVEAQARTAQDITVVGLGIFDWLFAQGGPLSPVHSADGTVDLGVYEPISAADLRSLIGPFVGRVPDDDGFGQPFDYYLDVDPPFEEPLYAVRSRGRDGVAEGDVYPVGTFPAIEFDRDMVVADFASVQFPDSFDELIFVDDFETGDARFWSALSP